MSEKKSNRILDKRKSMVKMPKNVSVHVADDQEVILTFSDGRHKETHSFSITKKMSEHLQESLGVAILKITEPDNATRH